MGAIMTEAKQTAGKDAIEATAVIWSRGDMSVGLIPEQCRVTMPARFIEDADDREFVRASLAECFGQLMDDSVTVWLPGDKQPA